MFSVIKFILHITCNKSLSSAQIAACFQSIFDWNGKTHEFDNKTGIQPAWSASRKRNDPKRRPRGTKQKVEFWSRVS